MTWEKICMVRGTLVTAVCLAFLVIGCGPDDSDGSPNSGGRAGSAGSGGTGGSGAMGGGAPKCDDAFAKVPSPYAPNTTLGEWGGFAVDERGAVFSAIADSSLTNDTSAYDPVIMAADLDGNLTTLHTDSGSSLFGNFILRGDSVYMVAGIVAPGIARLDRNGGTPVEVVEGTVFAGPILRGDFIYYAKAGSSDAGIYRLDPETDASALLIARDDEIVTIDLDGDTLYWIESDGLLEETDYRLFKMPAEGGAAELVQSLPRAALALGSFRVIDNVLFGSEITEDIDIVVTRTPIGAAPTIVEDFGGLPLVIAGGFAYYGAGGGGVVKAPLSFETKTTLPGTDDRAIYALAIGPSDLWYSEVSCIYRTAK
jgi:hypothetical protein